MKNLIKTLVNTTLTVAVTTVVALGVTDLYNKYKNDEVARKRLKRKLSNMNPFKKESE